MMPRRGEPKHHDAADRIASGTGYDLARGAFGAAALSSAAFLAGALVSAALAGAFVSAAFTGALVSAALAGSLVSVLPGPWREPLFQQPSAEQPWRPSCA